MKKLLLPILAIGLLVLPGMRSLAQAQDAAKPVAVLSIASYDQLMGDIAFIGDLTGNPGLDKNLEGMIQLFTQGQGLVGLDKKRPLGVTLTTDGLNFQPLIVLPVTDLDKLLGALEGLIGPAEEAGDGIYELDVFNVQIFVKEHNTWAYISTSSDPLSNLPDDGGKLFDGLEKQYDVAGRLHVQNVPEVFRTMLVDQLRAGVAAGLARQPEESDEAFKSRSDAVNAQIDSLTRVINDLEQLTLGLKINPEAKTAHLDLSFAAVPGTDTAKQLNQAKPAKSDFAGFLEPEVAASGNITMQLGKSEADQFVSALEAVRTQALMQIEGDEDTKKLASEMIDEVFDAITETFQSGKIDIGASLNLNKDAMALVVGAHVTDPNALEEALKKFAKLAADEPGFPEIKFDALSHAGIRFHTASIDVPGDRRVAKVLGDKLDVAVGIGEDAVYLALGTDSLEKAKKLIDRSKQQGGQPVPPFQLNVKLEPIFQFIAALDDGNATGEDDEEGNGGFDFKGLADDLAKIPGKDHVRVEYMPRPGGGLIRLSAEEGVLMLLGAVLQNAQASGAIPGLGL